MIYDWLNSVNKQPTHRYTISSFHKAVFYIQVDMNKNEISFM